MIADEARAGDNDASAETDPSHLQIAVGVQTLAHPHGDVDPLLDQIDPSVGKQDLQAQPRVVGQERRKAAGERIVQVQRAAEAHQALRLCMHPHRRLGCSLRRRRRGHGLSVDLPSDLGDLESTR